MERSSSELAQCQDSVTASSNDDEMLAESPSERNNRRCTEQKREQKFLHQESINHENMLVLPPFPEPSASCDLLLLSCHLFFSSNNNRLFDIAPFSENREASSHFLACKTK